MEHSKPRSYKSLNTSEFVPQVKHTYSINLNKYDSNKFVELWTYCQKHTDVENLSATGCVIILTTTEQVVYSIGNHFGCNVVKR